MKRAAIVLHSDNANRIAFWILGKPHQVGSINLQLDGEDYEIIMFEVPYAKDDKQKAKQRKTIDKFLKEEDVQYILYTDEADQKLERIWSTVKIIRILEEIGSITGECLLNQSFGIISKELDPILLEAISREASSMMVLKAEQDRSIMEEMHKKIITETGLSMAFISDAKYLIKQSRVIILDDSEAADEYKGVLPYPPINVKETLLLPAMKDYCDSNSLEIRYAEEIGKLIAKIMSAKDLREITCYYPNIHLSKEYEHELREKGILTNLKKSNKILTIQRC